MPLCSSQMIPSIFGRTAVHPLPSTPAADGINSSWIFRTVRTLLLRHRSGMNRNSHAVLKRAIESNPRQWQSLRNAGWNKTEQLCWSPPRPSLTFNQLSQQGRPAGMHESWQRQHPGLQLSSRWNQPPKNTAGHLSHFSPAVRAQDSSRAETLPRAEEQRNTIKACNYVI